MNGQGAVARQLSDAGGRRNVADSRLILITAQREVVYESL